MCCIILRKVWTDIGSKSRNGYYGAVLSRDASSSGGEREGEVEDISVGCYCARPGLRVWRADTKGKVSATLNFKQSIADSYITYPLSRYTQNYSIICISSSLKCWQVREYERNPSP